MSCPVASIVSVTYGLLANPTRNKHINLARMLLQVPAPPVTVAPTATATSKATVRPTFLCRHCGAPMLIIQILERAQHIRAPPTLNASP